MALTQVSTDGIKNSTISSADLGSNLKVTGSLFEVENTGGNANFEVTRVSGANFRIQSQASSVRLDTIGASHPILLGTNGNGRIRINDSTVDLINDNQRLRIGAGNDLQIYHDGSNSYIQNSTLSSLYINSASHIYLANADNSEFKAKFHNNSSVELYHDGSKKFETTSGGVDVTGSLSVANHITLPDQASGVGKLKLGDGVDFQLYHNGSHSVIENRTGNLIFYITSTGEIATKFIPNGAVELYHDNSKKFETTSTGATLTGTLLATTIDIPDSGYLRLGTGDDLQIYHNGSGSFIDAYTTDLEIRNSNTELMAEFRLNNAVDLYYDGTKRLSTHSQGAIVNGHTLYIRGASGEDARLFFVANDSASYNDHYSLNVAATGAFAIQTEVNANQFENLITATQNGNVELYHNNSKKFERQSTGAKVTGQLNVDDGSSTADTNGIGLGSSQDTRIFHDGSSFQIRNITGPISFITPSFFRLAADGSNDTMFKAIQDGAVELYHNNSKKFETRSNGIQVTGYTYSDGVTIGNGTSQKYLAGDASQLQMYHTGNSGNGYLVNSTGTLHLGGGTVGFTNAAVNAFLIRAISGGAAELYHNGSKKLETTSSGATVTGTLTATAFSGDGSGLSGIASFPSGTKMLFAQASAPTGWTKQTSHDNKALRLVTGGSGGGSGGSNSFGTAFNSSRSTSGGSVSNHTLSTSQIPAHNHGMQQKSIGAGCGGNHSYTGAVGTFGCNNNSTGISTFNTGGGGSHNHGFTNPSLNLNVAYVDVIMAAKD